MKFAIESTSTGNENQVFLTLRDEKGVLMQGTILQLPVSGEWVTRACVDLLSQECE